MLTRLSLLSFPLICLACGLAQGQRPLSDSGHQTIVPASYRLTDDNPQTATDLQAELKLMKLRLRELEIDVQDKLKSQSQSENHREELDKELAQRFDEIEEVLEEHDDIVYGLKNNMPNLLYHSHGSPKMQFFGRIHLDYWAFPHADASLFPLEGGNPQDRIAFRRVRIGVKGDINDNMFYKYEGEFAGGNRPSYRDVFIGFRHRPLLQTVIIGNHKRPYGLDHLNSSRYNVFIERPFVVEAFNQDSRRIGVSSNGVSEDEKYNWRFGVWNQQLTQNGPGYIGDHYQLEVAARLAATPWYDECSGGRGYAHFGISGSIGVPDGRPGITNNQARYRTRPEARTTGRWIDTGAITGAHTTYLIGLESVINLGSLQFVGEYMRNNVDRSDIFGEDLAFEGGYVQASYFLTGEHIPWNRKTGTIGRIKPFENFFRVRGCDCKTHRGWGAWQVAARYSYADFSDKDILGGEGESLTLGLNWYWNPYARMQFNYLTGDITNNPIGTGDYQIIGVRMMVDF